MTRDNNENLLLLNGIERLINSSNAFDFLNDDEELYSEEDIQEKTNPTSQ